MSLGVDNWPRSWSNVPTPCLAHDANPTTLAPHWFCWLSDGNWNGWLCCTALRYGFVSVKIWDRVFAASVSALVANGLHDIFWTNRLFFFLFNAVWYQ